jgi:signal transduction histidine kinase
MKPEGDAEMLLSIVGEEADRLNRIVGDLLDFVRPYELVKKPIAVEPVVAGAVDAATQAAVHHGVRVVTDVPKELPPFPLDAHLLKQALVNLVVNAAQAMPRGGAVQVRAVMEPGNGQGPWLCISVRDEGVGLTPRAAEKMFQPFFTTKATGTGLGLAVVKRIVDAHLGEISARPNEDGRGTTFTVRLPPSTESRAGMGTPPRPSPSAPRG